MVSPETKVADRKSIERLENRAAIADLVHRYAYYMRTGKGSQCGNLFTEDAVFEVRTVNPADPEDSRTYSIWTGRQEISDHLSQPSAQGIILCPLIHNLLIELDGDTAQSSSVMEARSWPAGNEVIGDYFDSFRKDAEGWRFTSRVYTIYGSPPA